ncbi:unnamed protein product [Tilletia laevis]|uniref:AMP-dependent synthetase/ligase domain-containing protein n=1 Tax=Tilletia laevis TaxID=157183 RepID=A0A9N8L6H2_9BASI|nr:unnamed protein product [Tilletia laevis]CAD6901837.1 unnamed protein product [Tilletia laevis]
MTRLVFSTLTSRPGRLPRFIGAPSRLISNPLHPGLRWYSRVEASSAQVPFRRDVKGRLLSRVEGSTESELVGSPLYTYWKKLAGQYASRPAIISKHEPSTQHDGLLDSDGGAQPRYSGDCLRWTYAELNEHVDALAIGLARQLGLRKGDRVAVLMGNSSAYVALQWSLAKVGLILVPLNPAYAPDELGRSLAHVQARALVLVPSLKNANYLDHLGKILPGLSSYRRGDGTGAIRMNADLLPQLEHLVLVDNLTSSPKEGWERTSILARTGWSFGDALDALRGWAIDYRSLLQTPAGEDQDGVELGTPLSSKDVINLQLTSGTTGLPKAVALTTYGMLNNGIAVGDVLHLRPDDIVCNNPPMFHCFGLTLGGLATQTHGACLLYASETFDPARTLAAVSEERATAMHGVPAMFFSIMDLLHSIKKQGGGRGNDDAVSALGLYDGRLDVSTLRTGLISGASIPVELMSRLLDELVPGLTPVYGMTETSPVSFGGDAVSTSLENKAQTVGRVLPHVRAKIVAPLSGLAQDEPTSSAPDDHDDDGVDVEKGTPLPVNTPGELCTSGYLLMDGYYNDPERTSEVMCEHSDEPGIVWMRTGDMATMDEQGWVRIVGRCKDVIIRGGENLFPATICNCIESVPGVGQSAVVAVPHERLGETVGAFIKRADEHESKDAQELREQIREHSAPDWIWILGEDGVEAELPKTASGKVQNVILRAWARDLHARSIGHVASPSRS